MVLPAQQTGLSLTSHVLLLWCAFALRPTCAWSDIPHEKPLPSAGDAQAIVSDGGSPRSSAAQAPERGAAIQRRQVHHQAAPEEGRPDADAAALHDARPRDGIPPVASGHAFRDRLRSGDAGPEMVVVPAGRFGQGELSERGMNPIAGTPRRNVSVPAFAIGRFEVSRAEFRQFVEAERYLTDAERNVQVPGQDRPTPGCPKLYDPYDRHWTAGAHWRSPGFEQDDTHPVVCVSWHDAQAYVAWLSRQTGKLYRLPTESELEYAIRAGSTTLWPWGNWGYSACDQANYVDISAAQAYPNLRGYEDCDDGYAHTAPVGRFLPNAFGLHDTVGNVQEWSEDCWQISHADAPVDGSAWTSGPCAWRVMRGGAWASPSTQVRSAARLGRAAHWRDAWTGIRVVRDL